jgi:tRNA A37 threonylcarbamoyladenosine dehydratase
VDEKGLHGLNCAGYGSSVMVTAAFGLAAAAHGLGILARPAA